MVMREGSAAGRPQPGDWVVIESRSTSDHGKRGLVLEILGESGHEHFRVRWDEEHESLFYPSGGFHIEAARAPCELDDPECRVQAVGGSRARSKASTRPARRKA